MTTVTFSQRQVVRCLRAPPLDATTGDILLDGVPLDLKFRTDMQYELRELQQRLGITFVFCHHDQEEAPAMSDWIFVMNDGEIVQSGNTCGYLRWAD